MSVLDRAAYAHQPINPAQHLPRVSVLRHLDGPDAIPMGAGETVNNRPLPPGSTHIGLLDTDGEVYRMRTQPHLYDEWHLEFSAEMRDASVPDDMFDWDCHRCKRAVLTADITDACPICGGN
jgi:hypothetical protein